MPMLKQQRNKLIRVLLVKSLMTLILLSLSIPLLAVPQTMTYQGVLSEGTVSPLNMQARIFDNATDGNLLWDESFGSVTITNGVFSLILGEINPLYAGVFAGTAWIELEIDGATLSPRQAIMSVPHAFTAEDAEMLDGNMASDFAMASQISTLQEQINSLMSALNVVQGDVSDNTVSIGNISTTAGNNAVLIGSNTTQIEINKAIIVSNTNDINIVENKVQFIGVNGTEMVITGANLNIVSGAGTTNAAVNGLGNLVIGYNEESPVTGDTHIGSHNLVVGYRHSYSSYAGFVAGIDNAIHGQNASVSGGSSNTASGKECKCERRESKYSQQ